MSCSKCKYELKDDMNFCPRCGTKVVSAVSANIFIDPNGRKYETVKIGEQIWMAENFDYDEEDSVCYDNNNANGKKYGRLYTWEMAINVCPEGWHLPSNDEWDKLCNYAYGIIRTAHTKNIQVNQKLGKYFKAKEGWNSYDYKGKFGNSERKSGNGEDKFGFAALPGGYYDNSRGCFECVGECGYWWSFTDSGIHDIDHFRHPKKFILPTDAYYYYMYNNEDYISQNKSSKMHMRSVRYVKD